MLQKSGIRAGIVVHIGCDDAAETFRLAAANQVWKITVSVAPRAMVLAGDRLFLAGTPNVRDEQDPTEPVRGESGARLLTIEIVDGRRLNERQLDVAPRHDGLIAANDRLFLSTASGVQVRFQ